MTRTVLFLCPHHAAKSVIAEAYFNQLATKRQLAFEGISAGTEPDAVVSPLVVKLLHEEGIDVSQHQPQRFTSKQLANAAIIVSMGCTAEELGVPAERVDMWNDVPPVSQNPQAAQQAIRGRVEALVNRLSA
jgi:protein-tyrosine-phosphatase